MNADCAYLLRLEAAGWRVLTLWECELKRSTLPAFAVRLDCGIRGRTRCESPEDPDIQRIAEGAAKYGR